MPRQRGPDIVIYRPQSPCRNCKKRWRTETKDCHSNCQEYDRYKNGNEHKNNKTNIKHKKDTPVP